MQAKKDKLKATAKNKIVRREDHINELIEVVEMSVNQVTMEERAAAMEGAGNQLNSEAQILDTEIDDLAIIDPQLGDRVEKLQCSATASAVKAMGSVRKFRMMTEQKPARIQELAMLPNPSLEPCRLPSRVLHRRRRINPPLRLILPSLILSSQKKLQSQTKAEDEQEFVLHQ